jgi:hypothetical protein
VDRSVVTGGVGGTEEWEMMGDWKPMETAPKDGTEILAIRPPSFTGDKPLYVVVSWKPYRSNGGYAWVATNYDDFDVDDLTNWCPLQSPPDDLPTDIWQLNKSVTVSEPTPKTPPFGDQNRTNWPPR